MDEQRSDQSLWERAPVVLTLVAFLSIQLSPDATARREAQTQSETEDA